MNKATTLILVSFFLSILNFLQVYLIVRCESGCIWFGLCWFTFVVGDDWFNWIHFSAFAVCFCKNSTISAKKVILIGSPYFIGWNVLRQFTYKPYHSLVKLLKNLVRKAHHCQHLRLLEKHYPIPSLDQRAEGGIGSIFETVKVLQLMEAEGIEPNLIMLNVLINAFGVSGRHLEALSVYYFFSDVGLAVLKGNSPDVVTYGTLMKTFTRAMTFDQVCYTFIVTPIIINLLNMMNENVTTTLIASYIYHLFGVSTEGFQPAQENKSFEGHDVKYYMLEEHSQALSKDATTNQMIIVIPNRMKKWKRTLEKYSRPDLYRSTALMLPLNLEVIQIKL
ncbi:hypothetical protein RHGRI_004658 [Rhododendron griersonianum]|uniref:Uncharacterized protein n=1 Tax=Rhododendron griersonianum TaxID=479676 RepID=A0AAV6LBI8_9ERIC|nr:hypothetical protein RHGRI_004658 [Rhododendron griersonianum]